MHRIVAAVDVPPAKQLEQFKNIRAGLEALSKIQSQYAPKDEPSTRAPAKEFTEFTKWLRDGGVEGLDKIEFKADLEHGNGVVAREALKVGGTRRIDSTYGSVRPTPTVSLLPFRPRKRCFRSRKSSSSRISLAEMLESVIIGFRLASLS